MDLSYLFVNRIKMPFDERIVGIDNAYDPFYGMNHRFVVSAEADPNLDKAHLQMNPAHIHRYHARMAKYRVSIL